MRGVILFRSSSNELLSIRRKFLYDKVSDDNKSGISLACAPCSNLPNVNKSTAIHGDYASYSITLNSVDCAHISFTVGLCTVCGINVQ